MVNKVLLADDSATIQKLVEMALSNSDFELLAVSDGQQAIDNLASFQPDIVLADAIMPALNGYEVCERVKAHADFGHVPVILLTGRFQPYDKDLADRVGVDEKIVKPFSQDQLIAVMRRLIEAAPAAAESAGGLSPAEEDGGLSLEEEENHSLFDEGATIQATPEQLRASIAAAEEPEPAEVPDIDAFDLDDEPHSEEMDALEDDELELSDSDFEEMEPPQDDEEPALTLDDGDLIDDVPQLGEETLDELDQTEFEPLDEGDSFDAATTLEEDTQPVNESSPAEDPAYNFVDDTLPPGEENVQPELGQLPDDEDNPALAETMDSIDAAALRELAADDQDALEELTLEEPIEEELTLDEPEPLTLEEPETVSDDDAEPLTLEEPEELDDLEPLHEDDELQLEDALSEAEVDTADLLGDDIPEPTAITSDADTQELNSAQVDQIREAAAEPEPLEEDFAAVEEVDEPLLTEADDELTLEEGDAEDDEPLALDDDDALDGTLLDDDDEPVTIEDSAADEPLLVDEPEPVAAAPAPEPAPAESSPLSKAISEAAGGPLELTGEQMDQLAEKVVANMVKTVGNDFVRDVIWQVVPELAEAMIRKRIYQLEQSVEDQ